jgi:hypothetical protein
MVSMTWNVRDGITVVVNDEVSSRVNDELSMHKLEMVQYYVVENPRDA